MEKTSITVYGISLGYDVAEIVSGDNFVIHECQAERVADAYVWIDGKRHHKLGKRTSFFETKHEAMLFAKARAEYYISTFNSSIKSISNMVNSYE